MFCDKCGRELSDNSEFCDKCGAKVVSVTSTGDNISSDKICFVFCMHCGAKMMPGDKFCSKCGRSVKTRVITPSQSTHAQLQKPRKKGCLIVVLGTIIMVAFGMIIFDGFVKNERRKDEEYYNSQANYYNDTNDNHSIDTDETIENQLYDDDEDSGNAGNDRWNNDNIADMLVGTWIPTSSYQIPEFDMRTPVPYYDDNGLLQEMEYSLVTYYDDGTSKQIYKMNTEKEERIIIREWYIEGNKLITWTEFGVRMEYYIEHISLTEVVFRLDTVYVDDDYNYIEYSSYNTHTRVSSENWRP